ncbi:MAG: hypothetical protein C5B52_18035 [Bacteroidetes bacterium]|nr:MAG: hypothetical protein C5B52_18035 [Bacteroidota bacterium]
MKRIAFPLLALIILGVSCDENRMKITNWKDYSKYLVVGSSNHKLNQIDSDILFWENRLAKSPGDLTSQIKIAGLLNKRFQYSGNIHEIFQADSLYNLVGPILNKSGSGIYRSLASNCVTQHKFKQADLYLDSAISLGDNLFISKMQKFDVDIELGNTDEAYRILQSIKDKNSFEYLIRYAKYKDHTGDLNDGILIMEKALTKISNDENTSLYCWTKSNLGDMYGHANRFEDSYQAYLEVLKLDPEYYHALKGIAWLAFSHDKDIEHSKAIVNFLLDKHPVPDYKLFLSQISDFEHNSARSLEFSSKFTKEVTQTQYGDMYNKYLFYLASDHENKYEAALRLAQREVYNRPTPESYNMLCWAMFISGNIRESITIAKSKVENKCFEPDANYHLGIIYKTMGNRSKARHYLNLAANSIYELGPFYESKIKSALQSL